jgi:SAM-dependent methyltransferase
MLIPENPGSFASMGPRGQSAEPILERVAHRGERHVPALDPESINHYRHMIAYHFALSLAAGRDVLDYGCGAGYGTNFVCRRGRPRSVIGMDIDEAAIAYCRVCYQDIADCFRVITGGELPFRESSFDLVLLFQVVEHVRDAPRLLQRLRRVLRAGGKVVMTTPNVELYDGDPEHPANVHHVREYSAESLRVMCASVFSKVEELAVHGSLRVGGAGLGAERNIVYRAVRKIFRIAVPSGARAPISLADFAVIRSPRRISKSLDLLFVCDR